MTMGNIKSRQAAMSFQSAGQRSGCRDCKHGGFKVSAMAICSKHEPKRQIGGAA